MGLRIALAALLLSACGAPAPVAVGAGCDGYREARRALPSDADLAAAPRAVLDWINRLDADMTARCRR